MEPWWLIKDPWRVSRPVVAGVHQIDKEPDPDPHRSEKSDPNPHHTENQDPDQLKVNRRIRLCNCSGDGNDLVNGNFKDGFQD
jgi:hypothetical protein